MGEDIKSSIITWIQAQPLWTQKACEKILKKSEITEDLLDELLVLLKTADGNISGNLIDFSFFRSVTENSITTSLKSIGDIHGIDELAPKTPLEFGMGLNVVYGNNGSGKSGYTRILKKITGKPDAVDLISNVFKPDPAKKSCKLTYFSNGLEKAPVEWLASHSPISDLQSIDIFDASSGGVYLEKETDASYIPIEVSLFDNLVQVFRKLKAKLEVESKALVSKLPTRPTKFGDSKYIKWMYSIKKTSDGQRLAETFLFTDVDEKSLLDLEEKIKIAPLSLAQKKQLRLDQISFLLDKVRSAAELVSQKSCDEIESLRLAYLIKQKATIDAAQALREGSNFDGIGEDSWKSLWTAAQKFSEEVAYKGKTFPNVGEGSHCVLCHQKLSPEAKTRLSSFSDYIKNQVQLELKVAKKAYEDVLDRLPKVPSDHEIKTLLTACQLDETKWLSVLKDFWKKVEAVKLELEKNGEKVSGVHFDLKVFNELSLLGERLQKEINGHHEDAKSFDIDKIKEELNELQSKKWASAFVPAMLEEIERQSKLEQISKWIKLVGTTSISSKSGEVSEGLLTEEYVKRFNTELKLLGAERISVELVKSRMDKGKPKHKLQLKNLNQSLSRIKLKPLSDGEKRIVSLAAFLADVMGRKNKSTFVFDDPISSLDQFYEENAAKRLIELSKDRQVIVFTHRLSLFGLLSTKEAKTLHIKREPWGTGEHGGLPLYVSNPMGAINRLRDERLAQAKKALSKEGSEVYNILAQAISSDLRIVIERIIEHELLGGIVLRHQRKLTTGKKLGALAKINKKDCEFLEGLMTEYSVYEHSQSIESPTEPPSPEKLEESLKTIIDWHSEFSKRATT